MKCDCGKLCTLNKLEIDRVSEEILKTIRNELPEECHRLLVVKYILEETAKKVEGREVKLWTQ